MKEITITCTWQSKHVVEVPDDFQVPKKLDDFPDHVLEELTSDTAELTDWE
jgi:hypothetical protein